MRSLCANKSYEQGELTWWVTILNIKKNLLSKCDYAVESIIPNQDKKS